MKQLLDNIYGSLLVHVHNYETPKSAMEAIKEVHVFQLISWTINIYHNNAYQMNMF